MVTLRRSGMAMPDPSPSGNKRTEAVVAFLKRATLPAIQPLRSGEDNQERSSERRLDNTAR
jgi:hypothetical protein